jgi:hypothetical protein
MARFLREFDSTCPVCRSREVRAFDFHGILDRILFRLMRIYPFWCSACDRQFYLFFPTSEFCSQKSVGKLLTPH